VAQGGARVGVTWTAERLRKLHGKTRNSERLRSFRSAEEQVTAISLSVSLEDCSVTDEVVVGRILYEKATRGGNERVKRRRETNRALEEEARRLREEGAHKYLRREALTRRDRPLERDLLVEQLKKGQPSD
jgi:hypothetical protein